MKIFLVCLESNVDGEHMFDSIPCATKEKAIEILQEEKNTLLNESYHYSPFTLEELKNSDEFEVEDLPDKFSVTDFTDDYWEDYYIEEKDVLA